MCIRDSLYTPSAGEDSSCGRTTGPWSPRTTLDGQHCREHAWQLRTSPAGANSSNGCVHSCGSGRYALWCWYKLSHKSTEHSIRHMMTEISRILYRPEKLLVLFGRLVNCLDAMPWQWSAYVVRHSVCFVCSNTLKIKIKPLHCTILLDKKIFVQRHFYV